MYSGENLNISPYEAWAIIQKQNQISMSFFGVLIKKYASVRDLLSAVSSASISVSVWRISIE